MVVKNINLGLTAAHLRKLQKLMAKLDMNQTQAILYCITKTAAAEGVK